MDRTLIGGILGSPSEIDLIISCFRSDPDIGMVVADGNIYREHHHWVSNERLLVKLLLRIGISPDVRDRAFPGGSIFWIRPLLLRTLASARISIADFEPEPVKEDGSLPHAVERIFGLICEDAGMRVVETRQLREIASPPDNLANVPSTTEDCRQGARFRDASDEDTAVMIVVSTIVPVATSAALPRQHLGEGRDPSRPEARKTPLGTAS